MTNSLLAHDHSELDSALAATFSALDAGDAEQSFLNLDTFWARLAVHIRAENVHLFPTLVQAAETSGNPPGAPALENVKSTIAQLRDDHDYFMHALTAMVKELRNLQPGVPQDTRETMANLREKLTAVSHRLEAHNALEESQVYLWAGLLLKEPEQQALGENIRRDLENLPPRLRKKSDPTA